MGDVQLSTSRNDLIERNSQPVLHSLRMLIEPKHHRGIAPFVNGSQMPNWCMNEIAIQGDKSELKKFADKSKGKDLSLETYYPEPDYEETVSYTHLRAHETDS